MGKKRIIDVRPQARLSAKKTFEICLSGIKHRLFRSTLTLSVITLAVAFFMFLLSESSYIKSIKEGVREEIYQDRIGNRWISTYFVAPSNLEFAYRMSQIVNDSEQFDLFMGTGQFKEGELRKLSQKANFEVTYLNYFKNLSPGKKINLLGATEGRDIFIHLSDKDNWEVFKQSLMPMISVKLPTSNRELRLFLDDYTGYRSEMDSYNLLWNQYVLSFKEILNEITKKQKIEQWMLYASEEELQSLSRYFQRAGFKMPVELLQEVATSLKYAADRVAIFKQLNSPEAVSKWKKAFLDNPEIREKMRNLDDEKVVSVLDDKYPLERLKEISDNVKYQENLAKLEAQLKGKNDGKSGSLLSGRQIFLLSISFLVCMVGITNAMLMAITERFREIATMKCLGAKDGFILAQFMMEAGLQGVVGGVLGGFIGLIMALLKGSFVFASYFWVYFPLYGFLISAVIAFITGIILSVLASIYPSWSASRMAPMEAMRVE